MNASAPGKPTTRERLTRAALELFQMRGYHAVGVSEILARAGAPKGSLYHHFPGGKAALAEASIDWLSQEIAGHFQRAAQLDLSPAALIEGLFDGTADWVESRGYASGTLLAVMAQEVVPQDEALTECLRTAHETIIAALAEALSASGADPALAAPLLAMLDGSVAQARAARSTEPFTAAKTAALRLVA